MYDANKSLLKHPGAPKWGIHPPPNFENFFLIDHICYYVQVISIGMGGGPLKLMQLYSMYFHLHRNSFYSVKFLKCESFLIALRRNSKKWTFLLCKILKNGPFLIALRRNARKFNLFNV